MSSKNSRREFLADVGRGTLVATVGSALASDMGIGQAFGDEERDRLTFGALEPLVALMQETSVDRLLPALVERLHAGTPLRDLLAGAALANARTFGGEDYVGFHTMMALAPAFHMARELPDERRPLPVLKVLYRNSSRIQEYGGPSKETLRPVKPLPLPEGSRPGEALRDAVRSKDVNRAEGTFAGLARENTADGFNSLLFAVQDNTEVHRTVLPYRAWDLLAVIGAEHAHTLLRQSVRYCVKSERDWQHTVELDRPRVVLPRLMDQFKLDGRALGDRPADDAWVEAMSRTIFEGNPEQAGEAVAAALAEGIAPGSIGEAVALAANQLILRDAGRTSRDAQPGKPVGSVHGDSIGVHACDSANAWRNMAAASNPRNTAACLILGAYQVALDRVNRGGDFLKWTPHPHPEALEAVRERRQDALLSELTAAVKANDQARAAAVAQRFGECSGEPRKIFSLLLGYAVSEDGSLHAEKFYRTAREEFMSARPAYRWRQVVALARVTASEFGRPAAGMREACALLRV